MLTEAGAVATVVARIVVVVGVMVRQEQAAEISLAAKAETKGGSLGPARSSTTPRLAGRVAPGAL